MGSNNTKFRTNMSKLKWLGPAHNGTAVWWMQRLTAIALVPLTVWFVVILNYVIVNYSDNKLKSIVESPFNTIMAIFLIVVSIYHSTIGMKEIVEDYVHSEPMKFFLCILFQFFGIATALGGVCALLVFHLSLFNLN